MLHPPIRVVVSCAVPVIAAGIALAIALPAATPVEPESAIEAPAVVAPVAAPSPASVATTTALDAAQFRFVVRVDGASYLELPADDVTPHALPHFVMEDGVATAIAPLTPNEVPEALRRWQGRAVLVDGACRAHVIGFARIWRLTGDPGYAGIAGDHWTAAAVVEHGSPIVAARLDGCRGAWARDASLPPAGLAQPIDAPALVAAARVDLLGGELAHDTQTEWAAAGLAGDWRTEVPISALAARHSITGERWIVLHAKQGTGCGDHAVNIVAVYRANADGTITRIGARTAEIDSIEQLVDIDGDGTFEIVATENWGLDRTLIDLHGSTLSTLPLQFYGCPC